MVSSSRERRDADTVAFQERMDRIVASILEEAGLDINSYPIADESMIHINHGQAQKTCPNCQRDAVASIDRVHRASLRARGALQLFVEDILNYHQKVITNLPLEGSDLPPSYTASVAEPSVVVLKRVEKRVRKLENFVREQCHRLNSAIKANNQLEVSLDDAIRFQGLHTMRGIDTIRRAERIWDELSYLTQGLGTEISDATLVEFREQETRFLDAVEKMKVSTRGKKDRVARVGYTGQARLIDI